MKRFLFTENEKNFERCFDSENPGPHVKDAFHTSIVDGDDTALMPQPGGSKAAAHYVLSLGAGESTSVRLRLCDVANAQEDAFADFDTLMAARVAECDAYYDAVLPPGLDAEAREISLQAYAGLLWSKQFYQMK